MTAGVRAFFGHSVGDAKFQQRRRSVRTSRPLSSRQSKVERRLSKDERHEHLGRELVQRVGLWELLGHVALFDGRAVDEVGPG